MISKFNDWKKKNERLLNELKVGFNPKDFISDLSEDILNNFSNGNLINKYSIYQNLMSYWAEVMQDDVYMISLNGWKAEISPLLSKKGKQTGW